jgi:hypothetical protein
MNFLDYPNKDTDKYCIIEEHDMEILDSVEIVDNIIEGENMSMGMGMGMGMGMSMSEMNDLSEVELLDTLDLDLVGCDEHEHEEYEMQEKHEINRNSGENEKPLTAGIRVEFRELEMTINTSTVEEVIFKKHRVEIVDKCSRGCIMEGVVSGYQLVGRVYDPDIVLEFEDGRTFYNENFGYLMRFYI